MPRKKQVANGRAEEVTITEQSAIQEGTPTPPALQDGPEVVIAVEQDSSATSTEKQGEGTAAGRRRSSRARTTTTTRKRPSTEPRVQVNALEIETAEARERLQALLQQSEQQVIELLGRVEETRQSLARVQGQQAQAEQEVRQAVVQAESLLAEVAQIRQRELEADRELRQRIVETEQYVQQVREDFQGIGQQLLKETRACLQQVEGLSEQTRQEQTERLIEELPAPVPPRPALPPVEAGPLLEANVRLETPAERLAQHLQYAWSVEAAQVDELQEMSEKVIDPRLRQFLTEHRQLTQKQKEALEERLRRLGKEPSGGGKGLLQRLFDQIKETWQREPDDFDRTMQTLLKAIALQSFEVAMYRSLAVLARAAGDPTTESLAERLLQEEQQAVDALSPLVPALARLAPQLAPAEVAPAAS